MNIIDNILEGKLWIAFLLSVAPLVYAYVKKDYKANPRQKYLPIWYAGVVFILIVLNVIDLFSIKCTWFFIAITTLVFIYIYLINTTINLSYEKVPAELLKKKLANFDIDNFDAFYARNKKLFITQLGKYTFATMCLDYLLKNDNYALCFQVMDDIQQLKLTNKEKRIFLIKQFNIYCEIQALKFWENKYDSIKELLHKDDQLYIDSILAYHKLDLKLSEKYAQKLLASTTNESYRQIAENNIGVVAENTLQRTEWNHYIHKSFTSSHRIKSGIESNIGITTLNLIYYNLYNEKPEKAEKLFQEFIKSLPAKTANQRIYLTNVKLEYYRQKNDTGNLKKVIVSLLNEYQNTQQPTKWPVLISLLRISFNHKILFEEVLSEVEKNIDDILRSDFSLIRWVTNEIFAIGKSPFGVQNQARLMALENKCIEKVRTIDVDDEISKLRHVDIVTKRSYIKFKSEISMKDLNKLDIVQYEKALNKKFEILDELIKFDEKQDIALNKLDSLFLKLDEIIYSIDMLIRVFKMPSQAAIIKKLYDEGNALISNVLKIIQRAENAIMMAEYHLMLAHYYCCLNNKTEGYKYFLKFKKTNVSLLNYASWLQEWYWRLENYFSKGFH